MYAIKAATEESSADTKKTEAGMMPEQALQTPSLFTQEQKTPSRSALPVNVSA